MAAVLSALIVGDIIDETSRLRRNQKPETGN
jgi:hypothetical protein